jgi:hypothetical protein
MATLIVFDPLISIYRKEQASIRLLLARRGQTAWSTKRYLNIELAEGQQMRGAITA